MSMFPALGVARAASSVLVPVASPTRSSLALCNLHINDSTWTMLVHNRSSILKVV